MASGRGVLGTFSIAARDERTGMLGVAVTSKAFSVGMFCPFAAPGAGAVATQSLVNPLLGPEVLQSLAGGSTADEALRKALAGDPRPDLRQLNVVDASGGSVTFTGDACIPWCGGRRGPGYALAGNILTGEEVVEAMERAYLAEREAEFGDRLLRALEAGQAAGGDARGKQSAAILVVRRTAVPYLRLQVEDHPAPLEELRRLYGLACEPDPDDGLSVLDYMAEVSADPAWVPPVDDDAWHAERDAAQARLDEQPPAG